MIEKLFKYRADRVSVQAFRYVLAGGLAYAIDYSALIMLTSVFRVHYLMSAAIAFMLGSAVSYVLSVKWIFDERIIEDRRIEASIFLAIGVTGLILNHYCILFFTESVKIHYLASKLISTIAVSAVNFTARKYILFRDK